MKKRISWTAVLAILSALPAAAQSAGGYAAREAASPALSQFAGGHGGEALLLLLLLPFWLLGQLLGLDLL